jgi:GAF domain-containing protein
MNGETRDPVHRARDSFQPVDPALTDRSRNPARWPIIVVVGEKGLHASVWAPDRMRRPRVDRESEAAARAMQGAETALLELLEADLRDGASGALRSVLRIAGATLSAQRFDDVIELVAEEALVALDAASFSISRWERERGMLRTLINVGELGPAEERFPSEELHRLSEYSHASDLVLRGRPYRLSEGSESEIGVPILYEAGMWGELWAGGRQGSRCP